MATGFAFAQEKEPTFEKQDDLVKATYYHDNGMIKEVGYFKDEKLHDQWIRYDNTGKISVVANYDNGIKEGKWYIVGEETTKEITYKREQVDQGRRSTRELSCLSSERAAFSLLAEKHQSVLHSQCSLMFFLFLTTGIRGLPEWSSSQIRFL